MSCADLSRIINSDQVQAKLREVRQSIRAHDKTKKNPLTNKAMMLKLNPFSKQKRELLAKREAERKAGRAKVLKDKRAKAGRAAKAKRSARDQALQTGLRGAYKDAEDFIAEEER